MRLTRLAALLTSAALIGFVVNFLGATAGHCGDYGCGGGFPDWLYAGSGWLVMLSVYALAAVGVVAVARAVGRRTRSEGRGG